jgi:hypothetical protein
MILKRDRNGPVGSTQSSKAKRLVVKRKLWRQKVEVG